MRKEWRELFLPFLFIAVVTMTSACSNLNAQTESVALGTAIGAAAGTTMSHNKWKGGVIGGVIGAMVGEAMYQIQQKAIDEAINNQKPVAYQKQTSNGGWERVEAEPVGQPEINPNEHTECQKVHVREIVNGKVTKDTIKEVCRGYKEENNY